MSLRKLTSMEWLAALVGVALGVVVTFVLLRPLLRARAAQAAAEAAAGVADLEARLSAAERRAADSAEEVRALQAKAEALRDDLAARGSEPAAMQARMTAEQTQAAEKLHLLEQAETRLREQFKLLAGEVVEQTSGKLRDSHQERLEQMLNPLRERIGRFEQQVRETYDKETRDRTELRSELKKLFELGMQMSEDATNLTQALKGDSKARGDWGELVLETLLERSGLERDREYTVQNSYTDAQGNRLRPDVVVHLPEQRALVIDSKVSLTAWAAYTEAEDDATRLRAGKAMSLAVRTHVKDLAGKRYHDLPGAESPDFVLMFVPIEPAFAVACHHDAQLFQDAFDQHIVIVSPTTLLATLRTVGNIWRYERQNRNAIEISRVAGALYDKFHGFISDMEQVGDRLRQAQDAHDAALNKLSTGRGNLVRTAQRIVDLGAKASKKLDAALLDDAGSQYYADDDQDDESSPDANDISDDVDADVSDLPESA